MTLWSHNDARGNYYDRKIGCAGPAIRGTFWITGRVPWCSSLLHFCDTTGKTVNFARTVDIPRSVQNLRFFASSVLHHTTDCSQMDFEGCLNYTIRCPVGVGESICIEVLDWCFYIFTLCLCVAGLISPWNLPLYLLTWKIAPAIATGNTVVAKPSEMTSVTAWKMCKLMQQAGTSTFAPKMQ